jgi:hypothetical protein
VGELLRSSWRTYRRAFVSLFLVGALPLLVADLVGLPSLVYSSRALTEMFRLLGSIDYRHPVDQAVVQDRLAQISTMPTDLRIIAAVASGAAVMVTVIGAAALTAAFLAAQEGRRIPALEAIGIALHHRAAIVVPAVLLGLGVIAVQIPIQLNQETLAGAGASAGSAQTVGGLLTALAVLIGVVAFYLGVRWGLAIPAILVEGIGLLAALGRSSKLTRGCRLRLGLAVFTVGLLTGVTVELPGIVVAVAIGFATGSAGPGVATFLLISLVGGALWAPIGTGILTTAYRIVTVPTSASPDGPA